MKTRILEELKNADGYISGQKLCEKCGVSRTAIWKTINQLKQEGYDIHSVTNRGYRLMAYPDILSQSEIESALEAGGIESGVLYYDTVDSTNTKAKLLGEQGSPSGTLVVADCQQSGKGRRGRSFDSPRGQSIYMTLLLRPDIPPTKASMITILAAMAVRSGLEEICAIKPLIKWPNDIVVNGKKICGILTEMSAEPDCINYVAVGIGINVNNDDMPEELQNVAVSVKQLTGAAHRRSPVIASVMKWFDVYYQRFLSTEDLSLVKEEYDSYLIHRGRDIEIIKGSGSYRAKSLGIAEDGELLIERDGRTETVISGEVSVRGVYGYV